MTDDQELPIWARPIDRFARPELYWALKGYGRLILLTAICVYGFGLILMRVEAERQKAERGGDRSAD